MFVRQSILNAGEYGNRESVSTEKKGLIISQTSENEEKTRKIRSKNTESN